MDNIQTKSFETKRKFFDDANFPKGFQRSGDFTRSQAEILESMGEALKALHEGHRAPVTDEEAHFVDVCQNKLEPVNDIERTWVNYLKVLARRQIYFTASSAASSDGGAEYMDSDD